MECLQKSLLEDVRNTELKKQGKGYLLEMIKV